MWRVLQDHGRAVISDIVSEKKLPPHLTVNVHLWGECISGALPEDEFMAELEKAGFFGVSVARSSSGRRSRATASSRSPCGASSSRRRPGCVFQGHRAVYLGPYVSVTDEEGHLFPRGQAIEVCTDTVAKLSREPYQGSFLLIEPGVGRPEVLNVGCGPGCC